MPRFQAAHAQGPLPERRLNYREVREQQQQQIEQLMKQHMEQQQQSVAATPDRIAKLQEDAKKFAQGSISEFNTG